MNWTDLKITVSTKDAETAEAIAPTAKDSKYYDYEPKPSTVSPSAVAIVTVNIGDQRYGCTI